MLIGQIAASVAHELNTPLGTILLRSQLVLRQHQDAEELSDLKVIESEAQRCRRIIDSLLSFSRRSEGAMSETDMTSLIEESLSIVGRDLENKGVAVLHHQAAGQGHRPRPADMPENRGRAPGGNRDSKPARSRYDCVGPSAAGGFQGEQEWLNAEPS